MRHRRELRGRGEHGGELRGWGLCLGDRPNVCCCTRSSIGSSGARIGLCAFTGLLSGSIWVVSSALTVRLANVLSRKRAVDFAFPAALVPALYPHSCGRFWPGELIRGDVFFFGEGGTIARRRCRVN